MYVKIETITPERAKALLNNNLGNRTMSAQVVKKYASDMKENKWELNGDSISISKNGVLKNGQHRLSACVMANMPFTTVVAYDVDEDVKQIDRGYKRSLSNILEMCGYEKELRRSVTVGGIKAIITTTSIKFSDAQFIKVLDYMREYCYSVSKYLTGSTPLSSKAGCYAAAIVSMFYGINEKILKEFFQIVDTGFAKNQSQFAAIVLRNYLTNKPAGGGAGQIKELYIFALQAIKDFSNGVPRKKAYRTDVEVPEAEGMKEVINQILRGEIEQEGMCK